MAARFERDVHRRALGPLAGRLQGVHLRVWPAEVLMPPLAHHLLALHDHTAHHRIRLDVSLAPASQVESAKHDMGRVRRHRIRIWALVFRLWESKIRSRYLPKVYFVKRQTYSGIHNLLFPCPAAGPGAIWSGVHRADCGGGAAVAGVASAPNAAGAAPGTLPEGIRITGRPVAG